MLLRARRVVFGILPLCAKFILISFPPSALKAAGYVDEKKTIVGWDCRSYIRVVRGLR